MVLLGRFKILLGWWIGGNAFCNSLQRFDFKGTLGPEGMLASDWLLSCVKFCAKPHFSLKEVGSSLFLAKKLTFLRFVVRFSEF